ncbi:oxidoreductase [Veronia nyctiphanis]|uniref:Oxidoreductase n=1 Tax=Veronia nyctiphanis TaxID=1278244 RepID=A0A4Q0YUW0_9GAMM|nr:SDR family NAD(P)-dependent oxidoreductase [Veronia nyctiphanis]RXJ73974.1 oxidoreductase [Veronia nyctiphanis]
MNNLSGKHVLVTGAGSGIGRQTAIVFAKEGANLWLVDIDDVGNHKTANLIEAEGGTAHVFTCDVSDADAMAALSEHIHQHIPHLDVLVNNAGIGAAGRFVDTSLQSWKKVLDINLMGVVHGCHFFLPNMVKAAKSDAKAAGHVINISSLAGFFAPPDLPIYSTSKFAVFGLSESLRADVAKYGIGVSTICPGIIDTPIVRKTLLEGEMAEQEGMHDKLASFYKKRNFTPHQVATKIVKAVKRNRGVCPVSPESWFMYYVKRFFPGIVSKVSQMVKPLP